MPDQGCKDSSEPEDTEFQMPELDLVQRSIRQVSNTRAAQRVEITFNIPPGYYKELTIAAKDTTAARGRISFWLNLPTGTPDILFGDGFSYGSMAVTVRRTDIGIRHDTSLLVAFHGGETADTMNIHISGLRDPHIEV